MKSNCPKRLVIISGLSGGGKSIALGALEDFGFHCIDNMPLQLLKDFVTLILSNDFTPSNVAIGIDVRAVDKSISQLHKSIVEIEKTTIKIELIFLKASQDCLLKRFSETRRKHPLSNDRLTLKSAIAKEIEILSEVNLEADIVIDTTLYNIHDLRKAIKNTIAKTTGHTLALQFISFGYKRGIPMDADFVFDVRCLPNPYWELSLRDKTGINQEVIDFLDQHTQVQKMKSDVERFLNSWISEFESMDKMYLTIAFGCTGGRHRSVYLAESMARYFEKPNVKALVNHRDI
ncbi:RNase adapter RapZ [Pseudomonadota bacterium]|nr:RNase adapter RapZ [Pseudomonadota bacterium]